jgi:hypothetical protein
MFTYCKCSCRQEWLGNVVRMGGKRRVKKLLEDKPGGGRKKKDLD